MSAGTLDHVIQETASALLPVFSIQPDESTDVAKFTVTSLHEVY